VKVAEVLVCRAKALLLVRRGRVGLEKGLPLSMQQRGIRRLETEISGWRARAKLRWGRVWEGVGGRGSAWRSDGEGVVEVSVLRGGRDECPR